MRSMNGILILQLVQILLARGAGLVRRSLRVRRAHSVVVLGPELRWRIPSGRGRR